MNHNVRIVLLLACLLCLACAVNPVSRESELMLISEQQEAEIGRQGNEEIKKEYGFYKELPGLQDYVKGVGERLAVQSERSDLPFRFKVLDTEVINAFALPGGYVYVTRGILARMSSEDELAAVVGHEIAHVAARHGAARLSRSIAAELLLGLGAMLNPDLVQNYGDLVGAGLGLAFLGYSRGQEEEADTLGLEYAQRAGYNPRGAIKLFKMFLTMQDHEPGKMERWLLSHPPTQERLDFAQGVLAEYQAEGGTIKKGFLKKRYLTKLDGLHLGDSQGGRTLVGGAFYHKEAGIRLDIPDGFTVHYTSPKVEALFAQQAQDPKSGRIDTTLVALEVHKKGGNSLKAFIDGYVGQRNGRNVKKKTGIKTKDGKGLEVRVFEKDGQEEPQKLMVSFVEKSDKFLVVRGKSAQSYFSQAKPQILEIAQSLHFLTSAEVGQVKIPRLKVRQVKSGETWGSLARTQYGKRGLADDLAAYNGVYSVKNQPTVGDWVKLPEVLELKPEG